MKIVAFIAALLCLLFVTGSYSTDLPVMDGVSISNILCLKIVPLKATDNRYQNTPTAKEASIGLPETVLCVDADDDENDNTEVKKAKIPVRNIIASRTIAYPSTSYCIHKSFTPYTLVSNKKLDKYILQNVFRV